VKPSRYAKIAANSKRPKAPAPIIIRGPLHLIDNRPIRKAALSEHQKAKRQFQTLQRDINRFHQKDKPQFEAWLRDTFGDIIREVTQVRTVVNEVRELIFEVETRTYLRNQSFAAAYRDVMERRQKNGNKPDNSDLKDIEEELQRRQQEKETKQAEESASEERRTGSCPSARLSPERASRLKSAYRSMARRFHPDCNTEMTPQMIELWHEAQRAYLAGDVELLESIDASTEDSANEVSHHSSISFIRARTTQLLQNHRSLARKLEDLEKDNAWGFSSMSQRSKLRKQMAKTLPEEVKSLKEEHKRLQEKIRRWREDAERYYPGFKEAMNGQAPPPTIPTMNKSERGFNRGFRRTTAKVA
jgi:hypothetical protein